MRPHPVTGARLEEGWHYSDGVQQAGPVPRGALVGMLASGTVHPTWLVWRAGMANWAPASSVPELAVAPGTLPPPLPAPPAPGQPLPAQPLGYHVPPPRPMGEDAGMRVLLPVGRSPWAIAAGYLGLLSPLLIFAPLAIVFGVLAIRDIRQHPDRHGMGRAIFALVMGIGCPVAFFTWIALGA